MSNPLYQEMMGNMLPQGTMNMINQLSQLCNDPVRFAISRGFNIPYNIGKDPNSMIQYLMNSGQVSQNQYNQTIQSIQNSYGQVSQILQLMNRR